MIQRGERNEWYLERPQSADQWRKYLRSVAASHGLVDWSEALAPALNASGLAAARLARVVKGEGVVISTGQQAALFGGPLYTFIKALSALSVADALERETGIPTAPVFWAATDDADYEEANWAAVAIPGGLRKLQLPPLERRGIPMNLVPMPGVSRLVEELASTSGAAVAPEALEIVRQSFTSGATLGNAYVRQLRALLEQLGIAVLDASDPAVRRAAAPVLTRALEDASAVERALRERYAAIERAGHTPQVEHVPTLSLVFASSAGGEKRRVPISEAEAVRAGADISSLGPNVLLRPLVERFIMPSAAYVGGPGEIAYFAQLSAAADVLEAQVPLVLPRWSSTIIEPRIERLLVRLGASPEEMRAPHAVEARLARDAMPPEIAEGIRRLREEIAVGIAGLEQSDRDKLVPGASLEGLRRSLFHRLDRAERRFLAAVKRRESNLMRDVATAVAALYPEGTRQERMLNFVPFLARYGEPLLESMRAAADSYATELLGVQAPRSARSVERV
jgi:bacillithiol biosynthesis cysteine-adding enzyme BshC